MLVLAVAAATVAGACGAARRAPLPYPGGTPPAAIESSAGETSSYGEAVAASALSLKGTPYENGGTGPDGFDCSGFVQYVYARAGLALPRSVREQATVGEAVDGEVRPGDLLFFAIDGAAISHVGIATGRATFVHAPSSRGVVREESLEAPYWSKRLAGVRRIVQTRGS